MTTTTKKLTIVLSERPPVLIAVEDWPLIASADWYSGQHERQANEVAALRVRQHEDGRTIVYCTRGRGPGGMRIEYRGRAGGYLLEAATTTDDLVRAIRRCGGIIEMDELADECIGDLPADEI